MNRELLLITIYCMVDDILQQPHMAMLLERTGRKPKSPDTALLSLAIFQEFSGIRDEDDYWNYVRGELACYFPGQLVDRSQYHRRKKNLSQLINRIRHSLLETFSGPGYPRVIDCLGTSVITATKFFRSQSFPNAGIGYCASKRLYYAGYKTATIVSPAGFIEDFVTDSAHVHDAPCGEAVLAVQGQGLYLGDKGFIFRPEVKEDLEEKGVYVITPQRSNMKPATTLQQQRLLKRFRPVVETVNGQLVDHFGYDKPGGKSERGVLSRLLYKIAAHTLGLAILRQFNLPPMKLDILTGLV